MHEAIILAGGLGTRLRSVVSDLPKVMAPVAGKPFLHYIIKKLIHEKVDRIILAVGYKHEAIKSFIDTSDYPVEFVFSVEEEPLGTGGGIRHAMAHAKHSQVFIINGDSFFDCSLGALMELHLMHSADISIALKPMERFDRYGTVELEGTRIYKFNEKQYCEDGFINAGVYVLRRNIFDGLDLPDAFSMEKDVFEAMTESLHILGFPFNGYFIDIGVPEDYSKAQEDFAK
jgi:D-glycero-alpha-D-manno-heptose 1-phosphate guanylyltransferase